MVLFIQSHAAILAGLGVALLDFLFAMNPKIESNGVIHMIYQFLVGKKA